jgi:translation initiation factor IF-2
MANKSVGKIVHYYDHVGVAVVRLTSALKVGDMIRVKRGEREFEQAVISLQVDRQDVGSGKKGQEVGMKISEKVKPGAEVIRLA